MVDTPKVLVGSTYHGVTVADDYRRLEDPESDQTRAWAKAQDRLTRSYLENLPFRDAVRRRERERAIWEEAATIDPGNDPALRSFHGEGVRSLGHFALVAASGRPQSRPDTLRHTAEAPPRSCDGPAWWSPRARMWGTCPPDRCPTSNRAALGLDRCRATSHVQRRR
jgi:Prolyl oligopeptidase, N-terminal beta-propeller domain